MVKAEVKSSEMTDMSKEQHLTDYEVQDQLPQEMLVEHPKVTVELLQATSPTIQCSEHAKKANVRLHDNVC